MIQKKILGLKNVTDTVRSLPDKWKQIGDLENSEVTFLGRNGVRKTQGLNCINEAGLYKLIMRSNSKFVYNGIILLIIHLIEIFVNFRKTNYSQIF